MDGFDDLTRIQRNTATRLRREDELDRKIELMVLIQSLNPNKKGHILSELIVVEALQQGFTEEQIDTLIDELQQDGFLKRVDDGVMILT